MNVNWCKTDIYFQEWLVGKCGLVRLYFTLVNTHLTCTVWHFKTWKVVSCFQHFRFKMRCVTESGFPWTVTSLTVCVAVLRAWIWWQGNIQYTFMCWIGCLFCLFPLWWVCVAVSSLPSTVFRRAVDRVICWRVLAVTLKRARAVAVCFSLPPGSHNLSLCVPGRTTLRVDY